MGGRTWLGVIATCCALWTACGGSATTIGDGDGGSGRDGGGGSDTRGACAPNATTACRGDLGCYGIRTCLADGSGFGPCECGVGNVGGSSGTIGTGGVGGSIIIVDAGSGTGGFAGGGCAAVSFKVENRLRPVHVLWALDSSASMADEMPLVQNNLNAFASTIMSVGIDLRVVLVSNSSVCVPPPLGSGSCPNDSNAPAYLRVDAAVGSGSGLNQIIQQYQQYSGVLEPGSQRYVGVISDSNSGMSAAQFSSALTSLDPAFEDWKFAGIVCAGTCPASSACSTADIVYQALVAQTGGFAGDFCALQNAMSTLAARIVADARVACFWDIPPPPTGEVINPNLFNVLYALPGGSPETVPYVQSAAACGTESGWYYDNVVSPTRFFFCPATCRVVQAAPDVSVEVQYGCYTIVRP